MGVSRRTDPWPTVRACLEDLPEEARIDHAATAAQGSGDVDAVIDAYRFAPFRTIVDVGGGRSRLLPAVLDAVPTVRGVHFDLAEVTSSLPATRERLTVQTGDVLVDPLPSADAYILMEVIRKRADSEATDMLRAIRRAACPGATVLIIEAVVPDDLGPRRLVLDFTKTAMTRGHQRTAHELRDLLFDAQFRLIAVLKTRGPLRIVEAVAV